MINSTWNIKKNEKHELTLKMGNELKLPDIDKPTLDKQTPLVPQRKTPASRARKQRKRENEACQAHPHRHTPALSP